MMSFDIRMFYKSMPLYTSFAINEGQVDYVEYIQWSSGDFVLDRVIDHQDTRRGIYSNNSVLRIYLY